MTIGDATGGKKKGVRQGASAHPNGTSTAGITISQLNKKGSSFKRCTLINMSTTQADNPNEK
jgi:hypothetical protein